MTQTFPYEHLLDIERLSPIDINNVLDLADRYAEPAASLSRKSTKLAGKIVVNLFFEPSTRTRTSFEIAAKRLGADVVNIAIEHSSTQKGETLLDTVLNLDAMGIDALIIRHPESGVPRVLSGLTKASIINAGDGTNEHPTQALVDALTMRRHKNTLKGLIVAICGDVAHSRVARSNINLLHKMGAEVRIVAPPYFNTDAYDALNVESFEDMKDGLKDADVVMMLRIQHERMSQGEFAVSLKDYHQRYGLDHKKLAVAKPDVIVMHPGPVNREVEITNQLADDEKYSVIREQVALGVAVRMALLDLLLSSS
ncbi:MAG: aspartate carbamoyltransferase catalytic subunit [Pseudomonadota bacterium]|nr:aspartate carbamoyltransferase catalytic subunit [Pseudomonadota bacterium]